MAKNRPADKQTIMSSSSVSDGTRRMSGERRILFLFRIVDCVSPEPKRSALGSMRFPSPAARLEGGDDRHIVSSA